MKLRLRDPRHRMKYGSKKTRIDGFTFDSIAEADYYLFLHMAKDRHLVNLTGAATTPILHIDVHPFATLGPGDRHCLDFLVIYTDGSAEFVDIKGASKTEAGRQARKLMARWNHPIPLYYVTRDGKIGWKEWE